jgi:hypothetical protein
MYTSPPIAPPPGTSVDAELKNDTHLPSAENVRPPKCVPDEPLPCTPLALSLMRTVVPDCGGNAAAAIKLALDVDKTPTLKTRVDRTKHANFMGAHSGWSGLNRATAV